jgi:RNA recognition motif-containing protein
MSGVAKAIWVANIGTAWPESKFREVFEAYGTIERVDLPEGRGGRKPYAFVHFATEEQASEAIIRANGIKVDDRNIEVRSAKAPRAEGVPRNVRRFHDSPWYGGPDFEPRHSRAREDFVEEGRTPRDDFVDHPRIRDELQFRGENAYPEYPRREEEDSVRDRVPDERYPPMEDYRPLEDEFLRRERLGRRYDGDDRRVIEEVQARRPPEYGDRRPGFEEALVRRLRE